MQIVIPMAGRGARFIQAGYSAIKPLIPVDGAPMIEHVVALFPGERKHLFICASDHLRDTPLRQELLRISPKGAIAAIEPHKKGPVFSALAAVDQIADDEPVILSYCDYSLAWDYRAFLVFVQKTGCDGCIVVYRGFHPHSLGPNLYGYVRTEGNRVREIREKQSFTDRPSKEFTSSGTYYFRTGRLMKTYFASALAKGLVVGSEYFASLPYNLMAADQLDIRTFEIDTFLQWGTPEDLDEYQQWSEYFTHFQDWEPAGPPQRGTLLLPMGGRGERFRTDGYSEPKPLIPIQGRPMLARTLSSLPRMDKALALAEPSLSQRTDLAPLLSPSAAKSNVIRLSGATRDAIETCLHARAQVDPDLPVLVAACDAAFVFDETAWKKIASDPRVDFAVWTFRNHPHANRNPKQYSWARTDAAGNVLDVAIKESLHPDPRADAGLTGTFYFRRAADFFSACETLKQALNPTGREQHLDWVIRVLTANGKHGCVFDVTHFICFGTPDDLRTFDYWAKYFLETRPRTTSEPRRKTG